MQSVCGVYWLNDGENMFWIVIRKPCRHLFVAAALLGAAALGNSKPAALPQQTAGTATSTDPNMTRRLDMSPLSRPLLAGPNDYYTYGSRGEHTFYGAPVPTVAPIEQQAPSVAAAHGGPLSRYVQGGGTGRSDSIDAKLSDGEYVIDSTTVSLLGDGSSKAGAAKLDQMRKNIWKHKGKGLAKGNFGPDAKRPEEYI
jgi:hypothetical protein